jgi:hypothetical protein
MSRRKSSSGGSKIGMIVFLVVLGYGGLAGYKWFTMRVAHYEYKDKCQEALKYMTTDSTTTVDDVQEKLYKEAQKLELPLKQDAINVTKNGKEWRVKVEYEREFVIPGITKMIPYAIDEKWKRI